jgi:hypothetical protein
MILTVYNIDGFNRGPCVCISYIYIIYFFVCILPEKDTSRHIYIYIYIYIYISDSLVSFSPTIIANIYEELN